jgi:hypothetical protein
MTANSANFGPESAIDEVRGLLTNTATITTTAIAGITIFHCINRLQREAKTASDEIGCGAAVTPGRAGASNCASSISSSGVAASSDAAVLGNIVPRYNTFSGQSGHPHEERPHVPHTDRDEDRARVRALRGSMTDNAR